MGERDVVRRRAPEPIDLHTHSSVSDGTQAPAELVAAARRAGLGTIALTDHDTTAGWEEARAAAARLHVAVVGGIELSTGYEGRSVHMLGYLVDPENPGLVAETARIRASRLARARRIVALIGRDYDFTWADVLAHVRSGATVGRPHIADALVARGYVPDRSAAFAGILRAGRGYTLPHYAPDVVTGVRLIRAAGGVPVLAHPATGAGRLVVPEDELGTLVEAGLFGLEVEHRLNTADGKRLLRRLAVRHGLVATGSSDYHGAGKPNLLGENRTPAGVLDAIVREATGSEPFLPASL
ncbi:MAG TPA: PHP domain-containing protein [Microbacteriaceae bacterium]|nr:PHP domain-containing protein [Microbacteriaceae bacterium]